ncbi:MAG: TonB-dependent receptor [Bacteroidetes bacterium]|nr:TonB-dependent receptor [Bacteroidota bacterium]
MNIILIFIGQPLIGQVSRDNNESDFSLDSLLSIPVNSAIKSWQTVRETPASVTIVTDKDIARFGYRSLEDIFRNVRGFYVSNDRNYTYVGVRGISRPTDYNNRILLLINGQTVNEPIYGAAPLGLEFPINSSIIERVEIIRGPGSVTYGTGAMFAVVNIVTKTGKLYNNIQISGEYESLGQSRISASFGKEISGVSVALSANYANNTGQSFYYKEFDTDSTLHGITPKYADAEEFYGLTSQIEYKNLKFQAAHGYRGVHIPTAPFGLIFGDSRTKTIDVYSISELKYNQNLTVDKTLNYRLYFHRYSYTGVYPYPTYIAYETSLSNTFGGELSLVWDISPSNRISIGSDFRSVFTANLSLTPEKNREMKYNLPFEVFSIYIVDEHQITKDINLNVGARLDKYSVGFSALSPRIAILINPLANTTLKFLYGSAFRSPNIYEMNYEDTPTKTIANHQLKPEYVTTLEMVAEQHFGEEIYCVGSLYRSSISDIIEQTILVDSNWQFQNNQCNRAIGFELEFNTRFKNGMRIYSSINYQHAVDTSTNNTLSNSPAILLKFGFAHQIPQIATVALDMLYETSRKTVFDTETQPFLLGNLTVNSVLLFEHLKLSAQIRNVFDSEYSYPGGLEHIQKSIIQNHRTFLLRATWQF